MLVRARNTSALPYTCSDHTGVQRTVEYKHTIDVTPQQWEALRLRGQFEHVVTFEPDDMEYTLKDKYLGYTSPINTTTGYGRQGYQILQNLIKSGYHVTLHEAPGYAQPVLPVIDEATKAVILRTDRKVTDTTLVHSVVEPINQVPGRRKICWSMWEADQLPREETNTPFRNWAKLINDHCVATIVPAQAQKEIFVNSGVKTPVYVVHDGIDTNFWTPDPKPRPNRPFTFLMYGYLNTRKDPLGAFNTFLSAFGPTNPDVRIVFKTLEGNFGGGVNMVPQIPQSITNVQIIDAGWREEVLRDYLRYEVDACFFTSFGEGSMNPPLEALAMGIPVIVPDHSGPSEYVRPSLGKGYGIYPIHLKAKVPAPQAPEYMQWWQPDYDHAIDQLRWVVAYADQAKREAQTGAQWVRERWSVEHQRKDLVKVLNQISRL